VTPEHARRGPPVIESADGTGSTDTGALGEAAQPELHDDAVAL